MDVTIRNVALRLDQCLPRALHGEVGAQQYHADLHNAVLVAQSGRLQIDDRKPMLPTHSCSFVHRAEGITQCKARPRHSRGSVGRMFDGSGGETPESIYFPDYP